MSLVFGLDRRWRVKLRIREKECRVVLGTRPGELGNYVFGSLFGGVDAVRNAHAFIPVADQRQALMTGKSITNPIHALQLTHRVLRHGVRPAR